MLNYTVTSIPVYTDRTPRHVVLYDEYNNLNNRYHTLLNEHALCLEKIKNEHNILDKAVADLTAGTVPDLAVTTAKLANNSVTTDKISDNAVTNNKLAGEIHSNKLKQPSKTDLYKYKAVTGYTKDLFHDFEPIICTNATIGACTRYIDDTSDGYDFYGNYVDSGRNDTSCGKKQENESVCYC